MISPGVAKCQVGCATLGSRLGGEQDPSCHLSPKTSNTAAPLSHPDEDTREKGSRKAAEPGECSTEWGFGIHGSWLGSSGHSPGLTGCSWCHRFSAGPGEPLQRPGPCPSPGVPSAHAPFPDLPSAAPPGRAAHPLCPAVLQGAGAQPGQGVGALGVLVLPWLSSGASCPPYSCPTCSTSHTPCACWCRRRRAWTSSR